MSKISRKTLANSLFFQQVREFLGEGKEVVFSLRGSSMKPFLQEGDLITIKPVSGLNLKVGHIVLAYFKNGYVLHRIIRLDRNVIYMAGDANLVQIEKIGRDAIIGFLSEAKREDTAVQLYTLRMFCYAQLWYYARPLRRVGARLFKKKLQ